ncbi:MAG: quinone-dependent dihydroorotate dehydrogenase [Verrucomicrobiota bacterium]
MTAFYKNFFRPLFFLFDPELIHHCSMSALGKTPIAQLLSPWTGLKERDPVELWGIRFPNRIGLAAGFDKDAQAVPAWQNLGFGHIELGTITRYAQPGNPQKRIFRIPSHQAVINRMGFPNDGADVVAKRLGKLRSRGRWPLIPVGINIGKSKMTELENAAEDYLYSFEKLKHYADYIAINVSSPNTPGLRGLQQKDHLLDILQTLQNANDRKLPILVKIAPDLEKEQISEVLECITDTNGSGIIATNTTIDHSSVKEVIQEKGGLSGQPVRKKSTEIIRFIAQESAGKIPIIGVGGIFTPDDVTEKLEAGASLLQAYTGFIYEGPAFCRRICDK